MPSITDIYNALVEQCVEAVYPLGIGQPSIIGTDVTIRSGYVNPSRLDALLAAGNSNVQVNMMNGFQRNVSRYARAYVEVNRSLATLILTSNILLRTVTVTGTITAGQKAVIKCNGVPYVYTVLNTDTTTTIAAALAALIAGASSIGNIITIPSAYRLSTRVGADVKIAQMLKRQESVFEIMVSSPLFAQRATLEEAIEAKMASSFYLDIPDDTAVHVLWMGTKYQDQFQKVAFYQCQLTYKLEFDTTVITDVPEFNGSIDTLTIHQGSIS